VLFVGKVVGGWPVRATDRRQLTGGSERIVMQLELQQAQEQDYAEIQTTRVSWRLIAANHILQQSSRKSSSKPSPSSSTRTRRWSWSRLTRAEYAARRCWAQYAHTASSARNSFRMCGAGATYANDEPTEERVRLWEDEDFDRLTRVVSERTLAQRLQLDMGAELPTKDMPIAEYLIGSLNDRGYLPVRPSEVAFELDVSEDRVNKIIAVLHAQEPVGIGTRNLRACLLLQIERLAEQGPAQPYASEIVSRYLTELGEHKFTLIARELQIPIRSYTTHGSSLRKGSTPTPRRASRPSTRATGTRELATLCLM
jgi:DNA-directed RNA polymerase specialized sigma54-like protein